MKRTEFTARIVALLQYMIICGERPILDYVKRSTEEQKRLFKKGLSKCDGRKKRSKHQSGKAADIYLTKKNGTLDLTIEKYQHFHYIWEKYLDGKPMLKWDIAHFE